MDPSGLLIVMCHGEHIVYRIRDKNGNWVNKDGGYTQTCVIINDGNTGGNRSGGNRGGGGGGGIHEAVPEEQKTRCPPNIADLLKKHPDWFPPVVEKVLAQASKDNPNRVDPGYYKEVGGWILMNPRNGVVEAYIKPSEPAPKPDYYDHDKKRWVWTRGDTTLGVMLDSPGMNSGALERLRQGWVVVADFHSHANKFQSPGKDQQLADDYKIPGIWIYPDATFEVYGPNRGIMNKGVPKGCPKN